MRVEERLANTTALILNAHHTTLADTISEHLIFRGCDVQRELNTRRRYDYIIVLGMVSGLKKKLQGNHEVVPFFNQLRDQGKMLIVVDETKEAKKIGNAKVPLVALDSLQIFSPDALAQKILHLLFTSKPITTQVEKSSISPLRQNGHGIPEKEKKRAIARRIFLILSFVVLLSPLLVFGGSTAWSAFWLTKAVHTDTPLAKRKQYIEFSSYTAPIALKSGSFLSTLIAPFSTIYSENVEGIAGTIYHLSKGAQGGIPAEEELRVLLPAVLKNGEVKGFTDALPTIEERLTSVGNELEEAVKSSKQLTLFGMHKIAPRIEEKRKLVTLGKDSVALFPHVLGFGQERKYLLLFQNNFELRPTGGFIGSYGIMAVKDGTIKGISVEDVYEADGQLKGHVEPPEALKKYLNQPNWFMRDSNWNPDFLPSAQQAEWFLEKETGEKVDGVISIDLYFVRNLLAALDGVYVPDYKARVTADDFFIKLQSDTHDDFFPGSDEKKNLLTSLLSAVTIELHDRKSVPYIPLLESLVTSLSEKHMLFYFHEQAAQQKIEQLGWGGRIISSPANQSSISPVILDYLMLSEANVGVNKVNFYIEREILTSVKAEGKSIKRELTVYYKNKSPITSGVFSGSYKNYLRVFIPEDAKVDSVQTGTSDLETVSDSTTFSQDGKQSIGFLVEVPQNEERKVVLRYHFSLPVAKQFSYYLIAQKQPGTDRDPFVFKTTDSPNWHSSTTTIPTLPYLNDLSVDRLLSLDFTLIQE